MKKSAMKMKIDIPLYEKTPDSPLMHCYFPSIRRGDGAVIIFSGGGYKTRVPHEAQPYASALNEMGISAFIVDYRVFPDRFPSALLDARRAVRLLRDRAEEFGINPEKIAVMGSSAGGHLAALVSTYRGALDHEENDADIISSIPNAQILCYPVTDIDSHRGSYEVMLGERIEEHESVTPRLLADERTPVAFIWHTSSDKSVSVCGSYRYAARLAELGVAVEMHVYPVGGHGAGLGTGVFDKEVVPHIQGWIDNLKKWLELYGWVC